MLERTVFLAGNEIVFLFEGVHAEEVFSWQRPELIEGPSFSPLPGPGDSEGGPAE